MKQRVQHFSDFKSLNKIPRSKDLTFSWLSQDCSALAPWRPLVLAYFQFNNRKPTAADTYALSKFLDRFLVQEGLPTDPELVFQVATALPDFFELVCRKSKHGVAENNKIHEFLEFVLSESLLTIDPETSQKSANPDYRNPVPKRHSEGEKCGQVVIEPYDPRTDTTLAWITQDSPELEPWRLLAIAYFKAKGREPNKEECRILLKFFVRFIIQNGLPTAPNLVLRADIVIPDFYETACPKGRQGVLEGNTIHSFLDFVLAESFVLLDSVTGQKTLDPGFHNPVPLRHTQGDNCGQITVEYIPRDSDPLLSWVSRDFPQLEAWRELAIGWFQTLKRPTAYNLIAISLFMDRFIVQKSLPTEPEQLLRKDTDVPDFFKSVCPMSKSGATRNNDIRRFLDFVLLEKFSTLDPDTRKRNLNPNYHNPVPRRNTVTLEIIADRPRGLPKQSDQDLSWVKDRCPHLESWRVLAAEWIKGPGAQTGGIGTKLYSISAFLERYILKLRLPAEPTRLLERTLLAPSFFDMCCPNSEGGVQYNNHIHDFLEFVLLKDCSEEDDHGRRVVSPLFHNPVEARSWNGARRTETNKAPLPYGYISRLRLKLVEGENFKDWVWAQNALGSEIGTNGAPAPDWFPINRDQIDPDDPDCVYRIRKTNRGEILEMWSPCRWVALLFKLLLPLRAFQVRMLDSGEGDTWWRDSGDWVLNPGPLAQGRPGKSRHQGFLHRSATMDGIITQLYANTNKTADIGKVGKDKGYIFPWMTFGNAREDVFYWAEKIRNWQLKYNPISRLTSWKEMDARQLANPKTDMQLAGYPDTAFLFRCPEARPSERQLPIPSDAIEMCWFRLLEAFEEDLAVAGETLRNGGRIELVPQMEEGKRSSVTTNHSLHSLRVSLITALAIDGKVPIEIMQKVVGHSRLLMTIYYVVPGESHIRLTLEEGLKKLEANADSSIEKFLLDTEFKSLLDSAIAVDPDGIRAAIPFAPGDRNPVGWEIMADGCCLMGGNTSSIEENAKIGGCYNGGPNLGSEKFPLFSPVPGGPRNCIRCRWFVTMPHYFYALVARLNRLFWDTHKEKSKIRDIQQEKESLENDRFDMIKAGIPFDRVNDLRAVERRLETSLSRFDVILGNIRACLDLIVRCEAALNKPTEGMGLVTTGSPANVRFQLEATDSELLQVSQICEDLEAYPDLEQAPDAVFRRTQLLDMALMNEGFKPLFLGLTEEQQKLSANAVMRELARRANPSDPLIGRVQVINLMDLKLNLKEHLGFGISECIPPSLPFEPLDSPTPINIKTTRSTSVLHFKHPS